MDFNRLGRGEVQPVPEALPCVNGLALRHRAHLILRTFQLVNSGLVRHSHCVLLRVVVWHPICVVGLGLNGRLH